VFYSIMFTNQTCITFDFTDDIDFSRLDYTKPICFNNVWINPTMVMFIEKKKAGDIFEND